MKKQLFSVVLFIASTTSVLAQLTGTNLFQFQYGQLVGDEKSTPSIYDRTVVNYSLQKFKAALTIEQYYATTKSTNYTHLSQLSLQYNSKHFDINVGNYYATLGRGILLRSYQIPGALLQDLSYRSQHYFHRDVLGASTTIKFKNFNTTLLYGKPLNNVYTPVQDFNQRRSDEIMAFESKLSLFKQTLGVSAMNLANTTGDKLYIMSHLSGNVGSIWSYYVEAAKKTKLTNTDDILNNDAYALYASLNFAYKNFGASAEFKNYSNFILGSGINEPPALIKEHSYKVLNRSTHVLQPTNEKGYQLEVYYTFADNSNLVFNHTLAINQLNTKKTFQELFAEYSFSLNNKHDMKLFADLAQDPFKLESDRISTGIYSAWMLNNKSTLKLDYEFQTLNRLSKTVQNHVFGISYSFKSKLALNLIAELSNDPFLINTKPTRVWIGTNMQYKLNSKNSIQLFAGQRRGGPACNAGVCYEVLDFKGLELRFNTRF